MRRLPGLAVGLAVLVVGCGNPSGPESPGREEQALAVAEAVHRYQFVRFLSEPQRDSLTYCLGRANAADVADARQWTEPPEALVRRFAGHQPPVKTMSACQIRADIRGVTDLETGGPAVIFRVSLPSWESDTEALANGGYYFNGLSGSGETYRLRFAGGAWTVIEVRPRFVF